MVNCGWSWGEMGKEGLRALESLDTMTNGHCESWSPIQFRPVSVPVLVSPPHSPRFLASSKPLPDPGDAPSDLSSILPSHSASQIALVLPPGQPDLKSSDTGHSIPGSSQPYSLAIPPAHSIPEHMFPTGTEALPLPSVEEDSGSDDHGPLEVVENDRIAKLREPKKRKTKSKRRSIIRMAEKPLLPNGSPVTKYKTEKDGNRKHGVFGTIAGLFTKSGSKKSRTSRTYRNLEGGSSDEDSIRYLAVSPSKQEVQHTGPTGERSKKRKKNRASTLDHPAFESHGWPSTAGKGKARAASLDHGRGVLLASEDYSRPPRVITRRRSSSQPYLPLPTEGASLSRDNSLTTSVMSSMSAPPVLNVSRAPIHRRRSTSGVAHAPAKTSSHRRTVSGSSGPVNPVHPQTNLMSIVEEAVRVNREARISMNPNNRLESIKAPPPASEVLKHEAEVIQANTQPPPIPQTSSPKPTKPKNLPPCGPENPVIKQVPLTQRNGDIGSPETTNKETSPPVDKLLPVKTPLKSALRNSSRTPSPNPSTLRPSVSSPPPSQLISRISETPEDDTASISSYETVHENLDSRSDSPPAPPVPPRDLAINTGVDSDLSHGTSSTAIASIDNGVPSRRKSVRMSLPPTYSITPPAREDLEVEKPPWSPPRDNAREEAPWTSRNGNVGERDFWEDSSDEGVEYSTARRLLSKLSGRH
ncbi:hypothetical protein BDM02DRAFT_3107536 [Thelephora ganbajun]|uniref:Uncharacterized protein n=1 Tax=Thelephora ganbajun TaxID=370292 RepID=A0ACB6ZUW9_THEGA|nr:hypothetical protein BDM02DRAFT_3107536 [Thelephora ganbajun]